MPSKRLFDRRYGKGAFARLRSTLEDPQFAFEHIANKFGLTRQYIAQVGKRLGIDGRRRRRERMLCLEPRIIKVEYPPSIRAVIKKIRRSGNQVSPYVFPPNQANVAWKSQKMVVVNGVLCTIQLRKAGTKSPNGREYARCDVNGEVKRAKVALWAMRSGRAMRVYVIPLTICEKSRLSIFPLQVNTPWATVTNPAKIGPATRMRGTCFEAPSQELTPVRLGTRFTHDVRRRQDEVGQ